MNSYLVKWSWHVNDDICSDYGISSHSMPVVEISTENGTVKISESELRSMLSALERYQKETPRGQL